MGVFVFAHLAQKLACSYLGESEMSYWHGSQSFPLSRTGGLGLGDSQF
jgi:hypothetical protein